MARKKPKKEEVETEIPIEKPKTRAKAKTSKAKTSKAKTSKAKILMQLLMRYGHLLVN
jgi:hypothetical protein